MNLFQGIWWKFIVQVKSTTIHKDLTGNKIYIALVWTFGWSTLQLQHLLTKTLEVPCYKKSQCTESQKKLCHSVWSRRDTSRSTGPWQWTQHVLPSHVFQTIWIKICFFLCVYHVFISLFIFSSFSSMSPHPWQQPVIRRIIQIVIWLHLHDTPWNHKQLGSAQSRARHARLC